jgi:hypothetical protein
MKNLATLAFAILLGSLVGCSRGIDPSAATPPTTPEQETATIEKAMESGEIDPATYGKE